MRTFKLLLFVLCLAPAVLLAQDAGDKPAPNLDPTARVPKGAPVLVRLPSPNRMDALGKQLHPLLKDLVPAEVGGLLEKGGASGLVLAQLGLAGKEIDRAKPVYVVPGPGGEVAIASTPENGVLATGGAGAMAADPRGTPTAMLPGDVSIHFYAGETVDAHRQDIEQMMQMAPMFLQMFGVQLPEAIQKAIPPVMDIARGGIFGIDGIDYSLTLRDGWIESNGRITSKAGSGMQSALARAGDPGDHSLAGMLPKKALMFIDSSTTPDWPNKETNAFFDKKSGADGFGKALTAMFNIDFASMGVTTGRYAMSVEFLNLQSAIKTMIYELKEGVDDAGVLAKIDIKATNEMLKKHQMPVSWTFTKDAAKDGETAIHKLEGNSSDALIAQIVAVQPTYFAVVGRYLVIVNSGDAANDIKKSIAAVRAGPDANHPHLKAMARLGRARHAGFTFNVGAVKPFLAMAGMMGAPPQLGQMAGAIPDTLLLSTAVRIDKSVVTWKGDWPLKEMVAVAKAARGMDGGGKKPPPDEDFD